MPNELWLREDGAGESTRVKRDNPLPVTLPGVIQQTDLLMAPVVAEEHIPVAATAIGFTASKVAGCDAALCTVETASIRITEANGSTPVAVTTGTLVAAGSTFIVYGAMNLANFRAIRESGTSATLDVQYVRVANP